MSAGCGLLTQASLAGLPHLGPLLLGGALRIYNAPGGLSSTEKRKQQAGQRRQQRCRAAEGQRWPERECAGRSRRNSREHQRQRDAGARDEGDEQNERQRRDAEPGPDHRGELQVAAAECRGGAE